MQLFKGIQSVGKVEVLDCILKEVKRMLQFRDHSNLQVDGDGGDLRDVMNLNDAFTLMALNYRITSYHNGSF